MIHLRRGLAADDAILRIHVRNHLRVLVVGWLCYVLDVALSWTGVWGYGGDAWLRLPVVVLGAVLIARLALRRAVAPRWEVAGFTLLTLAFLGHAVAALYAEGLTAATLLSSGMWLYLVYVYAFYVLTPTAARVFTGTTWTLALAGAVPLVLRSPGAPHGLAALVQFQAAGLVAIVLASVLASWRTALGEAQERVEEAERQSLTDALTGQPNRRALQLELSREIARARRTGSPFALLLLDLDHFKRLNDVHGHGVGDAVLMEVSRVVRASLRAGDELGRWGGEEFVVLAPVTSSDEAMLLAERLRQRLEDHPWPVRRVTASIGVTGYRPGDALEHLFKRADDALYRAKELGRNRCELVLAAGPDGERGPDG